MEKSFEYRIYPNAEQRVLIAKTFGCCRYVFNRALTERTKAVGQSPNASGSGLSEQNLALVNKWMKEDETKWLNEVDPIALRLTLKDLDRAFRNHSSSPEKYGFPRLKLRKEKQSYRTTNVAINDAKHVKIAKIGIVKAKICRPLTGRMF